MRAHCLCPQIIISGGWTGDCRVILGATCHFYHTILLISVQLDVSCLRHHVGDFVTLYTLPTPMMSSLIYTREPPKTLETATPLNMLTLTMRLQLYLGVSSISATEGKRTKCNIDLFPFFPPVRQTTDRIGKRIFVL